MGKYINFIFPDEVVSYVKKKKSDRMCWFSEQEESQNDREPLIVRGGGERKGVGSCAQVDRMALDVSMESSSEVTRGKDENLLNMQGVLWWVYEDVSME